MVFFTALACQGVPPVNELYARVDSASTVAISEPSKTDCESCETAEPRNAVFEGASREGGRVFFLTEQELLPGQKGANLYEYDFGGPGASPGHRDGKIALVSSGSADPNVQGVVRISENGERAYFVAKGKLAPRNAEGAEPEEADNLYVYESDTAHTGTYHVVFVGKLLSPVEEAAIRVAEQEEAPKVHELAAKVAQSVFGEAVSRGQQQGGRRDLGGSVE